MYLEADLSEPLKFLDELEAGLRGPALQRAINKAAAPDVRTAKTEARKVSKSYAKHVGRRGKRAAKTKNTGEAWLGIGVENTTKETLQTGMWGRDVKRRYNPSKLTHLFEGGFRQSAIRKNAKGHVIAGFGHKIAPRPLFKKVAREGSSRFERDFEAELRREVERAQEKAAQAAKKKARAAVRKSLGLPP